MNRSSRRRLRRGGFTLVEMLFAIAILAFLVIGIAAILGQINGMWTGGQSRIFRQQDGRMLLNFMARDIEKTMYPLPNAGAPSQTINKFGLDYIVNPTVLGGITGNYSYRDNIFFQAPIATDHSVSEIAEVGYFVQWSGTTAQLCRFFVNPSNSNYLISTTPTAWLTTTIVGNVAPGTAPTYQGLLAENVIGLWIDTFDNFGEEPDPTDQLNYDFRNNSGTGSGLPMVLDISILVLDPASAKKMAAAPSAATYSVSSIQALVRKYLKAETCQANLPAVLKPGSTCFTTRVQLLNYH